MGDPADLDNSGEQPDRETAESLRFDQADKNKKIESRTMPMREKLLWGFSINVIFMGFCALFTDVSGEMITAILPQYLLIIGSGSALIVTFVTSFSTAVANVVQGLAGFVSEHVNRRKAFVVVGYAVSNVAKPFIGTMKTWEGVLGLKITDRVGKGIRAAPRDTLVAHYATIAQEQAGDADSHSGRNFGVLRGMDTIGAVIGPLLAFGLLFYYINVVNLPQILVAYQYTILWSIVPGLIGVLFVALVKEIKTVIKDLKQAGRRVDKFPRKLARLILTLSIMQFATIDASFLIIRATGTANYPGLFPLEYQDLVPIAYAAYNVVYAVMAFYTGRLGDRMSKQKLIVVGLCVLVGVAVLAALPYNPSVFSMWVMIGIFLLLGVYIGIIDPSSSAFVSDITGKDKKGHAYALYYLLVGLISIPEGLIFGALYDAYGPTFAFSFEGVIIFVCIIIFARADFETRLKEVRASYSAPALV